MKLEIGVGVLLGIALVGYVAVGAEQKDARASKEDRGSPKADVKQDRLEREWATRPGDAEGLTRFRVVTSAGVLVIYDATIPPGGQTKNTSFVAYWNDFETEYLYVFDRLLFTPDDVTAAVWSLQRDFGLDPDLFVVASPFMGGAFAPGINPDATTTSEDLGVSRISSIPPATILVLERSEGDDGSWQPASRELVLAVMGFAGDEEGVGGIAATLWPCPIMAARAVEPLPAPRRGASPDSLLLLATLSAGCPPGGCGCCGDPCCIDPCSCDPCCVDPCSCDPCCVDPCSCDPCCGSSDPCCGNPDPCCGDDCDDGNPCTVDGCDAVSGQCTHMCDPPAGSEPCPDTAATPLLTLLDSVAEMDEALAPTLTGSCARLETDIPTLTECGPDLGAGSATGLYANGVLVSSGTAHLTAHPSLGTFDVVLQLTEGGGRAWTLSQTMRLQDSVLQVWGTVERIEVLGETTIRSGGWIYSAGGGAQEDPNSEPGFHGDAAAMLHCGGAVAALSPQDVLSFIANVASMMVYYVLDALIPYTPPTSCTGPLISDGAGQSCNGVTIPCKNRLDDMCLKVGDIPGVSVAFKKCMKGRCGCGGSTFPGLRISCADSTDCGPCGSGPEGCNLGGSQIWYCDNTSHPCQCAEVVFHEMSHACGALDIPFGQPCPPNTGQPNGACRIGIWFENQCIPVLSDGP